MEIKNNLCIKRESNIELLRCLLMFSIFVGHAFEQGINYLDSCSLINRIIIKFVGSGARIAVDCFVIITSWFYVEKKEKKTYVKALKLWIELGLSLFFIDLIFLIAKEPINPRKIIGLIRNLFPITNWYVWYGSVYIIFLLLIPLLDVIINHNSKCKKYAFLLSCLYFLINTFYPVLFITTSMHSSYSEILVFSSIYCIIAYIKPYLTRMKLNPILPILIFIVLYSIGVGFYFLPPTKVNSFIYEMINHYLKGIETFPCLIMAFLLFLFFLNLPKFNSKFINYISGGTFFVYVFHQAPRAIKYLWNDIFHFNQLANLEVYKLIFYSILAYVFILIISSLWAKFINNFSNKILEKFEKSIFFSYCNCKKK